MPLDDIAAELGIRLVAEIVIYGLCYWVGRCFVFLVTVGSIEVAPFSALEAKNKKNGIDWSVWLYRGQSRLLKAEFVCLIGLCVLAGTGAGIWLALK